MPKAIAKKKVTKKKTRKAGASSLPGAVHISDEIPEREKSRIIMIVGQIGSGKTFAAASSSEFAPKSFPAKKRTVLKDCLWAQTDANATAGFKHNNIAVPTFDFFRFMNDPAVYLEYGFRKPNKDGMGPPTITDATKEFLRQARQFVESYDGPGRPKIIFDTMSGYDGETITYFAQKCLNHPNQYEAYKLNLMNHKLMHSSLRRLNADIIYLAHAKSAGEETTGEKDKAVKVKTAAGGRYVPDITGAAPGIYLRDCDVLLVMFAYKKKAHGKNFIHREFLVGVNDKGWESKNRYEDLLPEKIYPASLQTVFGYLP